MNKSWLGFFINAIIGNLKLSISSILIRYEDLESNLGHPFAAGVTLEKLSASTVDDSGKEAFVTGGALELLQKVINVGTSICKVGFFGKTHEKLCCLTHIETLSVWDIKDSNCEANFEDTHLLASNSWMQDHNVLRDGLIKFLLHNVLDFISDMVLLNQDLKELKNPQSAQPRFNEQ